MRKLLIISLVAGALALGLLVPRGASAPALNERSARYEYAELKYTRTFVGQVAQPGAPPRAILKLNVVWTTADDDVEGDGWDDLAAKLKAPAAKNEGSDTMSQMRVFNRLGTDGWEVYEHKDVQPTTTWSFKRRLP